MAKRITKSFLKKLGYKSAAQASRKLKVPYSTLRNWLAGAKPRDLRRVERVRRRAIKQSPKAKKRRHPPRLKTKNYSQNELDHLTVFAATVGVDDLTSKKLTDRKSTRLNSSHQLISY